MSTHTQGDWILHDPDQQQRSFGHRDKRIMVLHPDGERLIACCSTGTTSKAGAIPREERLANARLIAASPFLLNALKIATAELQAIHQYYHPDCHEGCPTWGAINRGNKAIAIATHEKNSQPATEVAH